MKALLIALALLLVLTGCESEEALDSDVEFGKSLVADLQARNFDAIEARLDLAAWQPRAVLVQMAELLPTMPPSSIRVAGHGVHTVTWAGKGTTRHVALNLQYQFDDKWFVAAAAWRRQDSGPNVITGLRIQPIPASLEVINRFTLAGKSAVHYAVLALAVVLPIFSLAMLVLCVRTPMHWFRKTLWALAILLSVMTLHLNWTSGAVLWQPLSFQLFIAGYTKTELGPAILSVAFPLGAIIFLFRRRSLMRAVAVGDPRGDASEEPT